MDMYIFKKYDFDTIYDNVKEGKTDTLMVVTSQINADDEYGELITGNEPVFAGTTVNECRDTINWLVEHAEAEEYTIISFFAGQIHITPEDLPEECDDKQEFILDYICSHLDEVDNVGTSDWSNQCVEYKYESMQDGILLYWSWQKYIGYARKAIELEYCLLNHTTKNCKPVDKVFSIQCTYLLTSDAIMSCSDKEELIMLIRQKIDDMGKWQNSLDVEEFVNDLYEWSEIGRAHV